MALTAKEARTLVDTIGGALGTVQKAIYALADGGKPAINEERTANRAETPLHTAKAPDMSSEPNADTFTDPAMERMYQAFKNRIIKESSIDPILLKLLVVRPEIELEVERRVVGMDTSKPKGRIVKLISQGWFDQEPKGSGQVRSELVRTGADPGNASVGTALADLTREGFLERAGDRYAKAPGIKVSEKELSVTR